MGPIMDGWFVLVVAVAGWLNRDQNQVVEYLLAENAVLKEQLKDQRRLRFSDAQRRLLAVKAKALGRVALSRIESIVTPDTLLRWHRQSLRADQMVPLDLTAWHIGIGES
jgi:hypothetical protein